MDVLIILVVAIAVFVILIIVGIVVYKQCIKTESVPPNPDMPPARVDNEKQALLKNSSVQDEEAKDSIM